MGGKGGAPEVGGGLRRWRRALRGWCEHRGLPASGRLEATDQASAGGQCPPYMIASM
jgi:hypothetical protein